LSSGSGAPKIYVKTAESGNKRRQAFCGTCGTQLWACAVEAPESYTLRGHNHATRGLFAAPSDLAALCARLGG